MLIVLQKCKLKTLSMWPGIEEVPSNWISQSNVRSKLADIEVSTVHFWGHLFLLVESWRLFEQQKYVSGNKVVSVGGIESWDT